MGLHWHITDYLNAGLLIACAYHADYAHCADNELLFLIAIDTNPPDYVSYQANVNYHQPSRHCYESPFMSMGPSFMVPITSSSLYQAKLCRL